MSYLFQKFTCTDKADILKILKYYSVNSFAAYGVGDSDSDHYEKLFESSDRYPFYVVRKANKMAGFGLLRPYNKLDAFIETAEITYFIFPDYTHKGLGKKLLDILEKDALKMGIVNILANISSLNIASLNFHSKYGFEEVGRFKRIGRKFGKSFDVIWMQKTLTVI